MHPWLNIAIGAARQAGSLINQATDNLDRISVTEKGINDFVSNIDKAAEHGILETIKTNYPTHGYISEEAGHENQDAETVWIIDPLDGTNNFIHGFPHFAVSIGIRHQGRMEIGLVYDPIRNDLFTAQRGKGAHHNNRRIRVSSQKTITGALLGTGFPFRNPDTIPAYMKIFQTLLTERAAVRRAGAAALDLAYVAAGILDGFWEYDLQPWDIAAGVLLITEAGGLVGDFQGGETFFESGNIVGGNPKLFKSLLQTINKTYRTE